MAYVFIQLTTAGSETGPFNLYSNSDGYASAFESNILKSSLLSGIVVDAPVSTVMIRITSVNSICSNYIDLPVSGAFTSTTSTSTTLINIFCDTAFSFSGSQNYPFARTIILGASLGYVEFKLNPHNIPDRGIIRWNGNIVIDTEYIGNTAYDFGGGSRITFKNALIGKIDPVLLTTYPDFLNFPDDGYPRVTYSPSTSWNYSYFNKTLANPITATLEVYGPLPGTGWDAEIECPTPDLPTTTSTSTTQVPTTTTTTTPEPTTTSTSTTLAPTTTTTSTTELVIPFYYGVYNSPGGVVPIPNETNITILSGTLGGNPDGAINIPFASVVDDFIWFAIPSLKPTKTAWYVTALNQGNIGGAVSQFGNLFPDPVLKTEGGQEYKLYISNYRTSVTTIEIS